MLRSPIGLDGSPVFGCLWAVGPVWRDADVEALREAAPPQAPLTRLAPRLLVARTLGATTAAVRATLESLWALLRPPVLGRAAAAPRIWLT